MIAEPCGLSLPLDLYRDKGGRSIWIFQINPSCHHGGRWARANKDQLGPKKKPRRSGVKVM